MLLLVSVAVKEILSKFLWLNYCDTCLLVVAYLAYLPTSAYLPLPIYLTYYVPTYLPTYPTYLPTYLPIYFLHTK